MHTYQISTGHGTTIYVIADNIVEAHNKYKEKFISRLGVGTTSYQQSTIKELNKIHSITKSEYDIYTSNLTEDVNNDVTLYRVTYEPTIDTRYDLDIKLIALSNSQSLDKILKTNIIEVEEYTSNCIVVN